MFSNFSLRTWAGWWFRGFSALRGGGFFLPLAPFAVRDIPLGLVCGMELRICCRITHIFLHLRFFYLHDSELVTPSLV